MADFTYVADKVMEEEIKFDTLVSEFENGYEQRRAKRDTALRAWRLFFTNRTGAELAEVTDFFEEHKGSYESFSWENPNDEEEYTVRFKADTLKVKRVAFNIFSFEVSFVEVRT